MTDIVDDSGQIPKLRNRRVNILDVMATMRINPNPEYQFKEAWNLSDEEIEDVMQYIDENRDEIEELESEVAEEKEVTS